MLKGWPGDISLQLTLGPGPSFLLIRGVEMFKAGSSNFISELRLLSLDVKPKLKQLWCAGDQSIDRGNDDRFVCALMSTQHDELPLSEL